MIGQTLGNFEVLSKLGEGGMGEVYRARDLKLGRDVAIKVLPREMSGDPERIARFQREARTLATLQHPNVASVYGFEELPQARFLVMELVEGEDLAERLKRGPLSVEDAVSVARQITEGLEAAHEKNIVHRDLKPANIKIDPDGTVKILDFGLARAYVGDGESGEDLANSPTITAAMTQAGTILGTAAYMSPEQAKGRTVDKRADIWALGAILFEMLTGNRLFEAETVSETLARVLLTNIDWDALPANTPASVRVLMERCLQKDPRLRLRDVGEARIILADPTTSLATPAARVESAEAGRRRWVQFVVVALVLVAGVLGGRLSTTAPPAHEMPPLLFDIPDPEGFMTVGSLANSPNGESLVFARRDSLGNRMLYLRNLGEDGARPLPNTNGGVHPFWSPDSRHIGFFVGSSLFRMSLDGSAATQIAEVQLPLGGAWNADGTILVGSSHGPVYRVPENGGIAEPITTVEPQIEEAHCWPQFLPDGQHFVFLCDASSDEGHRLYICSLDGKEKKILLTGIRSAILVDPRGALLWSDSGQLFSHPFDFERLEFDGARVLVQDEVNAFNQRHELPASISGNGILATQRGSDESVITRVSLKDGSREDLIGPDAFRDPRVSPDGRLITFEIQSSARERVIWVQDLARGTRTRVSELGSFADSPVWTPDGEFIYFGAPYEGEWSVFRKRVFGGGVPKHVGKPEGTTDLGVCDLSPDGRYILVSGNPSSKGWDFWLGRIGDETIEWEPWLVTPSEETQGRFSPDSRWIAYVTSHSGQDEVYVSPVEGGAELRQVLVSVNGGSDPAWSHDGRSIFYRNQSGTLTRVNVRIEGNQIELDPPVRLMELIPPTVGYLRNTYDVEAGDESVIAFVATGGQAPAIRVRTGWRYR